MGTEIRTGRDNIILFPTGRNQQETAGRTGGHNIYSHGSATRSAQRPARSGQETSADPQGHITEFSPITPDRMNQHTTRKNPNMNRERADRSLFLPADIDQDQEGPAPDQISGSRPGDQVLTSYRRIQTRISRNRPSI